LFFLEAVLLLRYTLRLSAGLLVLALAVLAAFHIEAAQANVLPVLVYHHIQEKVSSDVSCTPEQFDSHIHALKNAGYTPLTLAQARLFMAGALNDVEKPVLITFDDGYESLHQFALPIATKYQVPMSVFVVTSRIGRKPQFARYLEESQIREMAASGFFFFGSHTHDLHTESTKIFEAFGPASDNPFLRLLSRDLRLSSARLEAITGQRPEAIAWPYGKYNPDFTTIARQNGYKLHFTSASGYNEPGTNPFAIKRIPITSRDTAISVLRKAGGGY